MSATHPLLLTLSLATVQALPAQSGLSKPITKTLPGGITQVINNGPSAWRGTNAWQLVLETTIQPKDGAPGELANPDQVLRTSHGEYIVADTRAPSITVFDASGRFVRGINRAGSGPGEYRGPLIALLQDTLLMFDNPNHRVTALTLDGHVIREFSARSNYGYQDLVLDRRHMIRIPQYNGRNWWTFVNNTTGQVVDSFELPKVGAPKMWEYSSGGGRGTMTIPFQGYTTHLMLSDGMLLYGNTGTYELIVSHAGRDTVRMFSRPGTVTPAIPDSLRHSMFNRIVKGSKELAGVAKLSDVPTHYSPWTWFFEDDQRDIWIVGPQVPGTPVNFDVFASTGTLLGTVVSPFLTPTRMMLLGDRMAVIDTDASDLPRIRIYRINRAGH